MRWQRDLARSLADGLRVPFAILAFEARPETLRRRILTRSLAGGDASEADLAVLAHQLQTREPLDPDEMRDVVACDAEAPLSRAFDRDAWSDVRERLWPPSAGPA